MGELWVDPAEVRTAAHRSGLAADALSDFDCPTWNPDALSGAAVGGVAAPWIIADRVAGLAARLRAWAADAQTSATAFEAAEVRGVHRLDEP